MLLCRFRQTLLLDDVAIHRLTYAEGIAAAIAWGMEHDEGVFLLGQEVGTIGGVNGATKGLLQRFGPKRVRDAPISEAAMVGLAVGAAMSGLRPIVEIMHSGLLAVCWDSLANQAAKATALSGGQFRLPLVVRVPNGAYGRLGGQLSHPMEGQAMSVPGLKVVYPSTADDAYHLLIAAIQDSDPVVFFEHRALYSSVHDVELNGRSGRLGRAILKCRGRDVTIVTIGMQVRMAEAAAVQLAKCGIGATVIDLRSLVPLDIGLVQESVAETGRMVILEENPPLCGWGAELAHQATTRCWEYLATPIRRVSPAHAVLGAAASIEDEQLPSQDDVVQAVLEVVKCPRRLGQNRRFRRHADARSFS